MKKHLLKQLTEETSEALKTANASSYYQRVFKTVSQQFLIYAESTGIEVFSIDSGIQFLEEHYAMSQKIEDGRWRSIYLRCINAISEYHTTGHVDLYLAMKQREYHFPDSFKNSANAYIAYRRQIGIIPRSNQALMLYLERFFTFLQINGISEPSLIKIKDIFSFLDSLNCFEKSTINHTFRAVRYYLKYCYEHDIIDNDLFTNLPNPHYSRQSRLPSSYSEDEVNELLTSVDLGNPCGIRDYAIILLISRLGLRSSDVTNLRFSNIDWEKDTICLTQVKTGNPLTLPLLTDVGEAIINYLKNARPKTDSDHVFVRMRPPYTEFKSGAVGALVRVHLQKSGISLKNKKKGSHTLRHSLASRLLEHEIPLPVISEILGHTNTETTMTYLRIDINELKKCSLEVSL